MSKQPLQTVVIGAGILGCATACRLAAAGRSILLIDRAEPGMGGASYGNAARIATELVEPIPSVGLLLNFWKELFVFGGGLDLPLHRIPRFAPWAARFAAAAFKRRANTGALTPIVSTAADSWADLLGEIGHAELLKRSGHYHFWTSGDAGGKAQANARSFESLGIASEPASEEVLRVLRGMASGPPVAGLWFPGSAHVVEPAKVCAVLAEAAVALGAHFRRAEVGTVTPGQGDTIDIVIDGDILSADEAVICAGPQSAAMLKPFGLNAPLEAARGYHIDLPGGGDHFGQSAIFMDNHLAMTPLDGRIRASSFLDFVEADAPEDPRKVARLIRDMQALGYDCSEVRSWFGSRSMLPDSLPGIGRARSPHRLYYAIGGQMIGLTIAAGASAMIRDLVLRGEAEGAAPFDLSRFG